MPRLISSLSRIFKFIALSWLTLIGLWTFLPSPQRLAHSVEHDLYIQQTLSSGKKLQTIHKWSPSFSADSAGQPMPADLQSQSQIQRHVNPPPDDCTGLIIDWRLVSDHQTYGNYHSSSATILEMGRDFRVRLNLTDAILKVQEDGNDVDDADKSLSILYISNDIPVQVDVGDENHVINMPWFSWADAALFHHEMHGFTYDIDVRVVARGDTGAVEIWKSTPLIEWKLNRLYGNYHYGDAANNTNYNESDDDEPILAFQKIEPSERSDGLLVSFSNILHHDAGHSDITIADMHTAELPSKTYTIRSLILIPLAPSLMVAFVLLSGIITPFLPVLLPFLVVYTTIVLICWAYYNYTYVRHKGRRNTSHHYKNINSYDDLDSYGVAAGAAAKLGFGEWCSRFWMTRHICVSLLYCCRCCMFGGSKRGKRDPYHHHYWAGEKGHGHGGKRVVIWGPTGPVYE